MPRHHVILLTLLSTSFCCAAQEAPVAEGESPVPLVTYEATGPEPPAPEPRWSDFLPIWGQQAREQGYVLPRPFGVSLGYVDQEQPFNVEGILLGGEDIVGSGLVELDRIDNREETITLRLDAWLFPFLNIYGVLGKTDGYAEGVATVNLIPNRPLALPVELDYEGDVRGGGLTIAGGYGDFFGMIDSNYTFTDLDISRTDAEAWVTSARLGWNGRIGKFTGALWVGAMNQKIDQTLDIIAPTPPAFIPIIGPTVDVTVEQSSASPWNTVLGGRWAIGQSFELLAEFGFGDRRSNMFFATYRF